MKDVYGRLESFTDRKILVKYQTYGAYLPRSRLVLLLPLECMGGPGLH